MNPNITPIIQASIQEWESAFPGLITSWYLLGSHTDQTAVPLSDLDLFFVLSKKATSPEDEARAAAVVENLRVRFPIKIEAWGETFSFIEKLSTIYPVPRSLIHTVSIKMGSQLLKGKDIRNEIPDPPMEKYVAALKSIAIGWAAERRKLQKKDALFRGLADGNTKALVQNILSIAGAMAAQQGQIFIPKKSHILQAYREFGDPRWLPLVEQAYETAWQEWGYRIPDDALGKKILQKLCNEAVDFEAYFEGNFLN